MWPKILEFWFGPGSADRSLEWASLGPVPPDRMNLWFGKSAETDRILSVEYGEWLERAFAGELSGWETQPRSRLALLLLLDQFSRNIHRGTPKSFSYDAQALRLAREGIAAGHDRAVAPVERAFYYLPFEHSEDLETQRRSVALFSRLVNDASDGVRPVCEAFHDYAVRHIEIIERFGRFPHRNEILGRDSTAEEIEFLKQPGSSF